MNICFQIQTFYNNVFQLFKKCFSIFQKMFFHIFFLNLENVFLFLNFYFEIFIFLEHNNNN